MRTSDRVREGVPTAILVAAIVQCMVRPEKSGGMATTHPAMNDASWLVVEPEEASPMIGYRGGSGGSWSSARAAPRAPGT